MRKKLQVGKRARPTLAGSPAAGAPPAAPATDAATPASGLVIGQTDRRFEESQAQIGAKGVGLPYINLFGFPVELGALKVVTEQEAQRAQLAPFLLSDKQLRLATIDPKNAQQKALLEQLKKGLRRQVYFVSPSSFGHIVGFYRNVVAAKPQGKTEVALTEADLERFKMSVPSLQAIQQRATSATTTELIDLLVAAALQLEASDVHLEPAAKNVRVRYRLDGLLQDAAEFPLPTHAKLVSRIKLLAKLKLNVTSIAQDGRFTIKTKERDIDVRVSILPSQYGEAIVLRLLGVGSQLLRVEDLGLRDYAADVVQAELKKPNGMILTTGPTGSGKTTTLYAFVNTLNTPDVKIITLEDPIEYRLTGIEQTQVDDAKGYSFARGLRSILRQDPDIILVGEVRDLETAETAVSAALTGHIVFSTLHTNDAAGALPRLIDMGVRPFVLAPAINAIIAQRLVRKVCQQCFTEVAATADELAYIHEVLGPKLGAHLPAKFTLAKPGACEACNFLGYKGRIGVFEVFRIDGAMEKLILAAGSVAEIRDAAVAQGMLLMRQDGVLKSLDHITTLAEVQRVV
ncbi:MAG: GspE/PulE family protein [Candidatus Andersenbacteria bacterium]